ncbi:ubiquitinyl hydrolase 1 [Tulasnella sp. 403]|nr:ubiquitinyl hydrolase 1 [Tulasnella sp. 403]
MTFAREHACHANERETISARLLVEQSKAKTRHAQTDANVGKPTSDRVICTTPPTPLDSTTDMANTTKNEGSWIPLESNPDVFNTWASKLGVAKTAHFEDVYGLDPELLAMVTQPVKAILLIFPITEGSEKRRKADEQHIKEAGQSVEVDPTVIFIQQKISNACGTIGLLHALLNCDVTIDPASALAQFQKECISKSPSERADLLATTTLFAKAHGEAATSSQSSSAVPTNLKTDLHYTCFVQAPLGRPDAIERRIVELDGRRVGPIDHGKSTSFLEDVAKVVKKEYISLATSMEFGSTLTLTRRRRLPEAMLLVATQLDPHQSPQYLKELWSHHLLPPASMDIVFTPIGGWPSSFDAIPTIVFIALYSLLLPFCVARLISPASRNVVQLPITAAIFERLLNLTVRLLQSINYWSPTNTRFLEYQQITLGWGWIALAHSLLAFWRSIAVNATRPNVEFGRPDDKSMRFRMKLITYALDASFWVAQLLGVGAGIAWEMSLDQPARQISHTQVKVFRYAFILIVPIYRLSQFPQQSSFASPSLPSRKVLFYIFHLTPEYILAACIIVMNTRRIFNTGPWGDPLWSWRKGWRPYPRLRPVRPLVETRVSEKAWGWLTRTTSNKDIGDDDDMENLIPKTVDGPSSTHKYLSHSPAKPSPVASHFRSSSTSAPPAGDTVIPGRRSGFWTVNQTPYPGSVDPLQPPAPALITEDRVYSCMDAWKP